tara:strand:+ start:85 stop:468 length:384 start_codon:yes stop_codon:yes gene_type:complete
MSSIGQMLSFIYTEDLASASAFLGDVLGFRLALNQNDRCHIYEVAPNAFLGVCTNRPPADDPAVTISFVSSDVDGFYERMKARGVVFDAPPAYSETFNVYSAFFRGIDSYRFEIQEFRDSSWPSPVS